MSTISAGTTTTTGYVVTSDTTGALVLKTGASGTTAVTVGADQSVTFAGSQTFSGGTANGVLYLNGSKAATSGSALTFNGTQLGIVNGAGSAILKLDGSSAPEIDFYSSGVIKSYIYAPSTSLQLNTVGANPIIFLPNEVEGMRLTSTGLGIGTSSPSQKLEVAGSVLLNPTNPALAFNTLAYQVYKQGTSLRLYANSIDHLVCDGSGNVGIGTSSPAYKLDVNGQARLGGSTGLVFGVGTAFAGGQAEVYSTSTTPMGLGTTGAAVLRLYTNSTLQATLDSSGNLGLGVTPSAWSGMKAFQLGDGTFAMSSDGAGAGDGSLTWNGYYNGTNWIYSYTGGGANRFRLNESGAAWFTAPSGTTGNPITFTQAMTLDASGNLLVGTTTAVEKVTVNGRVQCQWNAYVNGGNTSYSGDASGLVTGSSAGMWAARSDSALLFSIGSTERARITSAGNFLINTTANGSPGLGVSNSANISFAESSDGTSLAGMFRQAGSGDFVLGSGVRYSSGSNSYASSFASAWARSSVNIGYGAIKFFTAPEATVAVGGAVTMNERARINSSGNLVVGSTSSSFNERIASIHDSSYTFGSYRGGTGSEGHFIFVNANGAVGSIFTNGSATAYNTSSDYRLKNITGALTGYKERLMSLQPKQGTWIADGSEFRGFLAHEFANPYRASVTGEKDAVDESGNPIYQGMQASSSEVMADLVALVKEQQAIIDSLTQRIAALEGQ